MEREKMGMVRVWVRRRERKGWSLGLLAGHK
jgi:hypothetical protein